MALIRLVYASHASFPAENGTIDPRVGRILTQSRSNNARKAIGGVLYYGDGFFFQCLEGEATAVDALYERIARDERHHNAVILSREPVQQRLFSQWSMKYVPAERSVRAFLRVQGQQSFNPFVLEAGQLEQLLQLFRGTRGDEAEPVPAVTPPQGWMSRLKHKLGWTKAA